MTNLYPFKVARLIEGHLSKKLTAEEEVQFQDLLSCDLRVQRLLAEYKDPADLDKWLNYLNSLDLEAALSNVKSKVKAADRKTTILKPMLKYAAVLLLTAVGIAWYYQSNLSNHQSPNTTVSGFERKMNKIMLTLSDGKSIDIEKMSETVQEIDGTEIKIDQNAITYKTFGLASSDPNKLSVPTGKTFKINLADGTIVWLNNLSELTFPASFDKNQSRVVSLKGEAYFEVAHDVSRPFKVIVNGTEIKVLGTKFNVNAFHQKTVSVALLEGLVKMTVNGTECLLKSGEQAVSNEGKIKLNHADFEKVLAWKNGYFYFKEDGIEAILEQLTRWYDIKIKYSVNENPQLHYSGKIARSEKLEQVVKILADITGLRFKRVGNTLSVNDK
jgi:hypothetical protein